MALGPAYGTIGDGTPFRAFSRHITLASSPVAMTPNVDTDLSLPDLLGEFGASFGTYSAPEFTISESGLYKVELAAHFEGTDPTLIPDCVVFVRLDTGGGFTELMRASGGASDTTDPRELTYNYFITSLAVGDKLKLTELTLDPGVESNEMFVCTWLIEKLD